MKTAKGEPIRRPWVSLYGEVLPKGELFREYGHLTVSFFGDDSEGDLNGDIAPLTEIVQHR